MSMVNRQSTRITTSIPITITGKDSSGREFKENTRTIIVNKHGAKIASTHQLALGSELAIENRALGEVAQGTVVWFGERRAPKDPFTVGIRLKEARNIWGVEFAPEDWQRTQASATSPPTATADLTTSTGAVAAAPLSDESINAVSLSPPERVPLEQAAQQMPETEAAERFRKRLQDGASDSAESLNKEMPERLNALLAASAESQIQEWRNKFVEQLNDDLAKAQSKAQERQEQLAVEAKAMLSGTQEELQHSHSHLMERVNSQISQAKSEVQQWQAGVISQSKEQVDQLLGASMQDFSDSLRKHREEFASWVGEEVRKSSQESLAQFRQQIRNETEGAQENWKQDLKVAEKPLLEEARLQLKSLVNSVVDNMNREAGSGLDQYRKLLQSILQESLARSSNELRVHFEKTAAERHEAMLGQLQTISEEASARGIEQLKEQTRLQIESELGRLTASHQALVAELQQNFEQSLHSAQEKSREALQADFRRMCEEFLESASTQLRDRTEEALKLFSEQLKGRQEQAAGEAAAAFRAKIAEVLAVLQADAKKAPDSPS